MLKESAGSGTDIFWLILVISLTIWEKPVETSDTIYDLRTEICAQDLPYTKREVTHQSTMLCPFIIFKT